MNLNKQAVIWLTALMVWSIIVFAGHDEAKMVSEQGYLPVNSTANVSQNTSTNSAAVDSLRFPTPDFVISSPLSDWSQSIYWKRLTEFKRQFSANMRARQAGTQLGIGAHCKIANNSQKDLAISVSSSGSLSSVSPPGIVLRL